MVAPVPFALAVAPTSQKGVDCDGNMLDAVGVCGGSCQEDSNGNGICDILEATGCTDEAACNYDASAFTDDGSCLTLDECGVCGGPGAVLDCGCSEIPAGDCDCDGNQVDALGTCGGDCLKTATTTASATTWSCSDARLTLRATSTHSPPSTTALAISTLASSSGAPTRTHATTRLKPTSTVALASTTGNATKWRWPHLRRRPKLRS